MGEKPLHTLDFAMYITATIVALGSIIKLLLPGGTVGYKAPVTLSVVLRAQPRLIRP